jgi:hypothetical protein
MSRMNDVNPHRNITKLYRANDHDTPRRGNEFQRYTAFGHQCLATHKAGE